MGLAALKYPSPPLIPIPNIPRSVFRAYDIRGPVDAKTGITLPFAYQLGLAVAKKMHLLGLKKIVIGCDARLSSPMLKKACLTGLLISGIQVIDIGAVTTPMLYFATYALSTFSGIMVTASHNPAQDNGFKILLDKKTLSEAALLELYAILVKRRFYTTSQRYPIIFHHQLPLQYIDYIANTLTKTLNLKIVVDCGNAIPGKFAPALYKKLGCSVVPLFCDIDGRFPHHPPDPAVAQNLTALQKHVIQEKADIGLAFDGDADRLGVVTNTGEIIWPDRQLMLFASDTLSRHPGAKIVFDIKCSRLLEQHISNLGGHAILSATGHSRIRNRMQQENALLAGELSGHIFFQENWFGFDDGLYAGAYMLNLLMQAKTSASILFSRFPDSINTPEIKVYATPKRAKEILTLLKTKRPFSTNHYTELDGLRAEYPEGWGLIRVSNTGPHLTLRFEADTPKALCAIQKEFRTALLALGFTHNELNF